MKPIPPEIPETWETERLLARIPAVGDGEDVSAAALETWPALQRWMEWAAGDPPTPAQAEAIAEEARRNFDQRMELRFHLRQRGSGRLVGIIGLHTIDWGVPRFEAGYWCRTSEQGSGYATEALRGITRYCFERLGAERVEVRCDPLNTASRRVAERAGYPLEAVLRHNLRGCDGELRDSFVFALTRADYTAWLAGKLPKGCE